tara:strand:- start:813 stop:968 length:156 start_codon:yes stop_codon:yes gene_type:complete
MYKTEFKEQHKNLTELVSWLTTWQKYNQKEKRSAESTEQSIKRKRTQTNGH